MTRDELIARAKAAGLSDAEAAAKADAFLARKGTAAKPTPPVTPATKPSATKTPEPPKPSAAVSSRVPRVDKPVGAPNKSAPDVMHLEDAFIPATKIDPPRKGDGWTPMADHRAKDDNLRSPMDYFEDEPPPKVARQTPINVDEYEPAPAKTRSKEAEAAMKFLRDKKIGGLDDPTLTDEELIRAASRVK